MIQRNKLLKRTIVSKGRTQPIRNNCRQKPAEAPEYFSVETSRRCYSPTLTCEPITNSTSGHFIGGGRQHSLEIFPDPNDTQHDPDEFNSWFYSPIKNSSKKKPCCFCRIFNATAASLFSPSQFSSLSSENTDFLGPNEFCRECDEQSLSRFSCTNSSYREPNIATGDWFDNHSIPRYIWGHSRILDCQNSPEPGFVVERFPKFACSCRYCNIEGTNLLSCTQMPDQNH